MKGSKVLSACLFAVLVCVVSFSAHAAGRDAKYPAKPIKILIPEGPGGTNDVPTRALAKAVEKILGQPIVCVNMPGGTGTRVLTELQKEKPEGYVIGSVSPGTIIAALSTKADFSVAKDFKHVIKYQIHPNPVAVKKDAPWNNWEDFLKDARIRKEPMKIGMWGSRSFACMALEQIAKKENVTFTYVPFNSTGEAMSSILGGHTDVTTGSSGIMYSKEGGSLKTLLLFSSGRIKDLPGVPAASEKGYSGLGLTGGFSWLVAPKGLPGPILKTLQDAFKKGIQDEEYLKVLTKYDLLPDGKSGKEFGEELKTLEVQIGELLKQMK
jgi:tripartite-type tricarboxylate transporter receptor subunit TctC